MARVKRGSTLSGVCPKQMIPSLAPSAGAGKQVESFLSFLQSEKKASLRGTEDRVPLVLHLPPVQRAE